MLRRGSDPATSSEGLEWRLGGIYKRCRDDQESGNVRAEVGIWSLARAMQGQARIFMFERGALGELVGETRACSRTKSLQLPSELPP